MRAPQVGKLVGFEVGCRRRACELGYLTDRRLDTKREGRHVEQEQVLCLLRVDVSEDRSEPRVYINPEITVLDQDLGSYEEGCLSVPGFYETVERPAHIRVTALGRDGQRFEEEPQGLLAVCIQHEMDHLKGKLFVDYLSPLKRNRIRSKLEKQHRRAAS